MYRKYQNSTKSSRYERLAQLTEQESVIERKKREILAKLEAQKKKETEEALRKLEPCNTNRNEHQQPLRNHSSQRESEPEDEEETIPCPRNAFSNDGSFLDHFKKLSSTGLGSKNVDAAVVAMMTKKDDEANKIKNTTAVNTDKSEQDISCFGQIGNNKGRHEYNDPSKNPPYTEVAPSWKQQGSNIQADSQYTVAGTSSLYSQTCDQPKMNNPVPVQAVALNPVSSSDQKTSGCASSVSETPLHSSPASRGHQYSPFENSEKNASRVHNIPPPYAGYLSDSNTRQDLTPSESRESDGDESCHSKMSENSDMASHTKKCEGDIRDEKIYSTSNLNRSLLCEVPSVEKTESLRVSPALNANEAGESETGKSSRSTAGASRKQKDDEDAGLNSDDPRERLAPEKNSPNYISDESHRSRLNSRAGLESKYYGRNSETRDGESCSEERSNRKKRRQSTSEYDSNDSDTKSGDSYQSNRKTGYKNVPDMNEDISNKDGYQADGDDEPSSYGSAVQRQKKISFHRASSNDSFRTCKESEQNKRKECEKFESGENSNTGERRKRKKKSRWGDEVVPVNSSNSGANLGVQLPSNVFPLASAPAGKSPMLSKLTRSDPGLIQYARQTFGSTNLSEEDWKKAEDHYKINLLYQDMVKKRAEIDRLEKAGKFKYEYDSDEDVEGGTWEHKLRQQEMMATQLWAEELTRQAAGKHHIGDFLPPEELERFMEKYNAVKQGRNPDLSDYKEFKLKEDNVGYRLLQKMGWNEGQGLGQDGTGITNPVNKATTRHENQGLGVDRPDGLQAGDDEYDAYRKRMMLAYRFRPNPLNNPRRPYY